MGCLVSGHEGMEGGMEGGEDHVQAVISTVSQTDKHEGENQKREQC